mmetsp:Transcript_30553/g.48948  ORF Transcript_30553/g.48948 Transcript_30553/m.48948 type:complete len:113 (+) Transcript_30553:5444-5782(+)
MLRALRDNSGDSLNQLMLGTPVPSEFRLVCPTRARRATRVKRLACFLLGIWCGDVIKRGDKSFTLVMHERLDFTRCSYKDRLRCHCGACAGECCKPRSWVPSAQEGMATVAS